MTANGWESALDGVPTCVALVGGDGTIQWVKQARTAKMLANPAWEPLHAYVSQLDWEDFVSTPLLSRGKALGALNVYLASGHRAAPAILDFLGAMAEQAALAIAMGEGIQLPPSVAQVLYPRLGVAYVEVEGVQPWTIALAWLPPKRDHPFVEALRDTTLRVLRKR
ncbi:GAF domain-containing protein [Streptomyces acidicola]|uniref:GAF domain-containing protein n=1 Tax=Streptomyces acidicola TaxID=2596892 RepID=UPI00343A4FA6